MPDRSPWHQLTDADLAVPGHDPETCATCAPARTPAFQLGVDRALENTAVLPLTSGGPGA